jgi:maleate cis-trans isomerase
MMHERLRLIWRLIVAGRDALFVRCTNCISTVPRSGKMSSGMMTFLVATGAATAWLLLMDARRTAARGGLKARPTPAVAMAEEGTDAV